MERMSIEEILFVTEGTVIGDRGNFISSISTNSKDIDEGALFVPIKGERVDSHEFIKEAFANGAVASFTERTCKNYSEGKTLIKVQDTIKAMQKLAEHYRLKFLIPVIGITGSVGKTTIKEMMSSIFCEAFNVLKTDKNFNGQLGVPLTIFNLDKKTELAIVEMGISLFGEMERIARVVRPNFAVISNIGVSHIENLGTRENILKEKLHISDFLSPNDTLFLNGDNDILKTVDTNNHKIIFFGLNEKNDFRATDVRVCDRKTLFNVMIKGKREEFMIPSMGTHDVYNALAAISVAIQMGLKIQDVKNGLSKYKNLKMRQELHTINDIDIIDDSYNASPDSMKSAIDLLKEISRDKLSIAVLADMLELGEESRNFHIEVGKHLSKKKIDVLYTVGKLSKDIATGVNGDTITKHFFSNAELIKYLNDNTPKQCTILVKGSRGMHTDEIVKSLIKRLESKNVETRI